MYAVWGNIESPHQMRQRYGIPIRIVLECRITSLRLNFLPLKLTYEQRTRPCRTERESGVPWAVVRPKLEIYHMLLDIPECSAEPPAINWMTYQRLSEQKVNITKMPQFIIVLEHLISTDYRCCPTRASSISQKSAMLHKLPELISRFWGNNFLNFGVYRVSPWRLKSGVTTITMTTKCQTLLFHLWGPSNPPINPAMDSEHFKIPVVAYRAGPAPFVMGGVRDSKSSVTTTAKTIKSPALSLD